jgi:hypothetical protein
MTGWLNQLYQEGNLSLDKPQTRPVSQDIADEELCKRCKVILAAREARKKRRQRALKRVGGS